MGLGRRWWRRRWRLCGDWRWRGRLGKVAEVEFLWHKRSRLEIMDDVGRVVDVDLDRVDLRCGESGCDQPNQVTVAV